MCAEMLGVPRASRTTGGALGTRLRNETLGAHVAAEEAFDLPRRLRSIADYADGLRIMDAFLHVSAPGLAALAPSLPAELRHGPEHRRARLCADLAALGQASLAPTGPAPSTPIDDDHALGAWYVHEGSALGGVVIAAEVRRRLPAATGATSYFAGEGRRTAARWRTFQAVLDGWEQRGGAAVERVLAGALQTFGALAALLEDHA